MGDPPKLLDRVRHEIRARHYSGRNSFDQRPPNIGLQPTAGMPPRGLKPRVMRHWTPRGIDFAVTRHQDE